MSLKTKIPLILVVVVGLYSCLDFALQQFFVVPQFLELEHLEAEDDLNDCRQALAREIHYLDQFCLDWSAWDDMYDFVSTGNQTFIEKNLPDMTFTNYGLNLLYVVNAEGDVIWGRLCKPQDGALLDLPPFLPLKLARIHPLLNHQGLTSSISGLVMTPQGPMMVASRRTLKSVDWSGSNGTLIMGKFLSEDFLDSLRQQTSVDVQMWPLDGRLLPEGAPALAALQNAPTAISYVVPMDDSFLHAYGTVQDIYGRPAVLFRVVIQRDILRGGLTATKLDAIGAGIVALVMLLFGIMLTRRSITEPLARLTEHVTTINQGSALPLYAVPARNDEIGILARQFNSMILRLREDLSERQKASDALREREERLRTILDAAPDGILTVDESASVESANRAALHLLQYEEVELVGKPISLLAPTETSEQVRSVLLDLLAGKDPQGFLVGREVAVVRKDGRAVPVHLKASLMTFGDRTLCTAILRDLTDFKAMHEQVARASHLAAIGEMGASVAHEIRNPLAGISGAAQVLHKQLPPDHQWQPIFSQILALVNRIENTVRQLLSFARDWHPKQQPVRVLDFLQHTFAEPSWKVQYPAMEMAFHGDAAAVAHFDADLLRQVCVNLAENAAQAMNGQGHLDWEVGSGPDGITLILSDQGGGLAPEARARLFQPFFTTKTTGTGLGLAICKRIIDAHHGRMEIEEIPEGGTRVIVTLPHAELPAATPPSDAPNTEEGAG